jgi:antitoxin component YwqK of YwqJK toxin-antitoxin module
MWHKDVLVRFKDISHISDEDIKEWFPNGKNSIRVVLKNDYQLVFIYNSAKDWCLETRVSYENRLSEKSKLMRKAGK